MAAMQRAMLGQTGIEVSRIGLGTMTWGCQNTEADAFAQMDYALDKGVFFWDTAELYAVPPSAETYGLTEQYIGTWFEKTGRRDDVVLASKMAGPGRPWIRGGAAMTPETMRVALEGSLTRLKTDRIDLYQLHWPGRPYPHHQNHWNFKPATDAARQEEAMLALLEQLGRFVKEGKIRAWGLSNDTPWGVMTYNRLAEKHNLPRVASVQNEYSLLYRWEEPVMHEVCALEGVGFLPYSPLAMGVLTGKYLGGVMPEGSRAMVAGNSTKARMTGYSESAVQMYKVLAETHGLSLTQMALAWTLTRPFVTSTLIGATTMAQLEEDIAAAEVVLDGEVLSGIEDIRRRWPVSY